MVLPQGKETRPWLLGQEDSLAPMLDLRHSANRVAIVVGCFLCEVFLWKVEYNGVAFCLVTLNPVTLAQCCHSILKIYVAIVCNYEVFGRTINLGREHLIPENLITSFFTIIVGMKCTCWLLSNKRCVYCVVLNTLS